MRGKAVARGWLAAPLLLAMGLVDACVPPSGSSDAGVITADRDAGARPSPDGGQSQEPLPPRDCTRPSDAPLITTLAEWEEVRWCRHMDGYIRIGDLPVESVVFPYLEDAELLELNGAWNVRTLEAPVLRQSSHVTVLSSNVERLTLSSLQSSGIEVRASPRLREIHVPVLAHANYLKLQAAGALERVELPEVLTLDGIDVENCHLLQSIRAPKSVSLGRIVIVNNASLTTAELPGETVFSNSFIVLRDNPALSFVTLGHLRAPNLFHLENLPALASLSVHITGDLGRLVVRSTGLTALSLPDVTDVYWELSVEDNPALGAVTLDLIEGVRDGSDMVVQRCPSLTTLHMPSLRVVAGELRLNELPSLVGLDLGELRDIGAELFMRKLDASTSLELPKLNYAGRLRIIQNASLATLRVTYLERVFGDFALTSNPVLSSIDFFHLSVVEGGMTIDGNPLLPLCEVAELVTQVESGGGEPWSEEMATCLEESEGDAGMAGDAGG